MKISPAELVLCSALTAAVFAGCSSPRGRQVSLSNDRVPARAESSDGVISAVGRAGNREDQQVFPIEAARTEESESSSWSRLLSPFKPKRKRIPLPLTKPEEGRPDIEVGIDEF